MDTLVEIDWFWMALKILAVIVLVGLNGFFVAAEFALVKIRDTQLQPLVDEGQRRAKVAHYILNNLDAFLSACQLGITLASLALGWNSTRCQAPSTRKGMDRSPTPSCRCRPLKLIFAPRWDPMYIDSSVASIRWARKLSLMPG